MDERKLLSPRGRLCLALLGLAAVALLAVACGLKPDPRGYGTHEQLGLAPCGFARWTGWPCPTCGMTTAWTHAVRGDFAAAAAVNLGGAALCVAAVLAGPWAVGSAIAGRWLGGRPTALWMLWIASGLAAVTLLDWARRLVAG